MQNVIIEVNKMDGTYDVEVFLWNNEKNKVGSAIQTFTDFGLEELDKNALLQQIPLFYHVLETKYFFDGSEEKSSSKSPYSNELQPLAFEKVTTYQIKVGLFLEHLSSYVAKWHGWDIEFTYDTDEFQLYWEFNYRKSAKEDIANFENEYRIPENLVEKVLSEEKDDYYFSHINETNGMLVFKMVE